MSSTWWDAPPLQRAWTLVAERLEREGLVARGLVTVPDLGREEQRAVSDLLGRSVLTGQVRIDLAALDRRLRDRAGTGLVEAAAAVLGRPLADRPAARAARAAHLEEPYAVYAAWREAHPDAAGAGLDDRLDEWLAGLRRDGVLTRDADPADLVRDALAVLWHQRDHFGHRDGTGAAASPPVARTELAARLLGDAHALDDDRRLGAVVLRAARLLTTTGPGEEVRPAREEWESLGHGDFDWAGIAMAEDVVRRFRAQPWRMSADVYLALPARLPLHGTRVEASWDPELAPAMARRGHAVHEEAALPGLTDALAELS